MTGAGATLDPAGLSVSVHASWFGSRFAGLSVRLTPIWSVEAVEPRCSINGCVSVDPSDLRVSLFGMRMRG